MRAYSAGVMGGGFSFFPLGIFFSTGRFVSFFFSVCFVMRCLTGSGEFACEDGDEDTYMMDDSSTVSAATVLTLGCGKVSFGPNLTTLSRDLVGRCFAMRPFTSRYISLDSGFNVSLAGGALTVKLESSIIGDDGEDTFKDFVLAFAGCRERGTSFNGRRSSRGCLGIVAISSLRELCCFTKTGSMILEKDDILEIF